MLTHAHLDHCGYLPRLVSQGFRGRVFCTAGTKDLCRLVLPDSGRIQEEDAANANRHRYSKHEIALPLYTEADALNAVSLLQPVGYDRPMPVADGIEVDFINAGHLLGSAYARIRTGGKTILFGGDLGRFGRPVLPDPTMIEEADYLLVESTYGNRVHDQDDDGEKLATLIRETAARGGKMIVPAFAIGRVEELLYWIKRLEEEKRIPILPVFVDSPMAVDALARYTERLQELDPELQPEQVDEVAPHGPAAHEPRERRRQQARQERDVCAFCTQRFRTIGSAQESKELTASQDALDRDFGERHGDRRPRACTTSKPHCRIRATRVVFAGYPGGRHAWPAAGGWRARGEDPRPDDSGPCAHREARLDVGACRLGRDPALAEGLQGAASAHVSRARRTARDAAACRPASPANSGGTCTRRRGSKRST